MKKLLLSLALGLLTCSAGAAPLNVPDADIIPFDVPTGTGFIFKSAVPAGDPAGISFTYQFTSTYNGVCTFKAHDRTRIGLAHTSGDVVNSALYYFSGLHNVFGGFELTGFGTHFESGDAVPILGGPCKKGKATGAWTRVDEVNTFGGLYVIYGTTKTLLY